MRTDLVRLIYRDHRWVLQFTDLCPQLLILDVLEEFNGEHVRPDLFHRIQAWLEQAIIRGDLKYNFEDGYWSYLLEDGEVETRGAVA